MDRVINFFKKNKTVNIFNPYFLFSVIFLAVLLVYQLNWSQLNIPLSLGLFLFLLLNIVLFFFFGYLFDKRIQERPKKSYGYKKSYPFISVFILLGTLIEGIVLKGYPLFNSLGWGTIQYIEYGIPMFHVVLLTVSYFFSMVVFETIIHGFKNKKMYLLLFITLVPFILTINRGMLVMLVISYICLYTQEHKIIIKKKIVGILLISAVIFFYLFGLFGNYRINADYKQDRSITDSSIIMDVGEATNSFRESYIPKEFFWLYTYVTTPLANLQHNMEEHINAGNKDKDGFFDFIKITFLPETLSKRMNPTKINNYRVREELTVGTAYYEIYPRYGWTGMWIYLLVISVFPFLYLELLKKFAGQYINIGMALVCTMYTLLFFTNFLSYTGLAIQLFFPFILSVERKNNIGSRFLKLVRK